MDVILGCIFLLGDAGGPTGSPGGFPEATLMGWGGSSSMRRARKGCSISLVRGQRVRSCQEPGGYRHGALERVGGGSEVPQGGC